MMNEASFKNGGVKQLLFTFLECTCFQVTIKMFFKEKDTVNLCRFGTN